MCADDCTLDEAGLLQLLGPRTRLVAVGLASNAVGTINPVGRIAEAAHAVGARVWVDAVHAAPHLPIDVTALGADYLVCSPYKFFGPHMGPPVAARGAPRVQGSTRRRCAPLAA